MGLMPGKLTLTHVFDWLYFTQCPTSFSSFSFSSDAGIFSTIVFPPLENFDHIVVSVSSKFPSNSKWDALFHCRAYDYSTADWDCICDHLRDVPWISWRIS